MCFVSHKYQSCSHNQILLLSLEPTTSPPRAAATAPTAVATTCPCPTLHSRRILKELCPHCRLYHTDAGFYRRKWERAIGEMEGEYWRIIRWIKGIRFEEDKEYAGMEGITDYTLTLCGPRIRLEEKDLEELYRAENGPLIEWEERDGSLI
ncbi:hypothetical protein TWF506_004453 [Arthrobotrys conoides]|uniref:Uncharacterized protein n=1 Tax=Arthrobotrys conoides TaxID=74498 RepID=A0AAN8N0Q6_9PEZI